MGPAYKQASTIITCAPPKTLLLFWQRRQDQMSGLERETLLLPRFSAAQHIGSVWLVRCGGRRPLPRMHVSSHEAQQRVATTQAVQPINLDAVPWEACQVSSSPQQSGPVVNAALPLPSRACWKLLTADWSLSQWKPGLGLILFDCFGCAVKLKALKKKKGETQILPCHQQISPPELAT